MKMRGDRHNVKSDSSLWSAAIDQHYLVTGEVIERPAGRPHTSWLVGHSKEQSLIPQPVCEKSCRAGTEQATLETIIGSKHWNSENWLMMLMSI